MEMAAMEASKNTAPFEVRSSWAVICGQFSNVVDVIFNSCNHGSSRTAGDLDLSLVARSPGPCDITVEFQHGLCHVRSVSILSSSRNCEIYSLNQSNGDMEYICTVRGMLQEEWSCYNADVQLNSLPCAAFKIRLLSLKNAARADVKKITVHASAVTPPPSLAADKMGSNSNSTSSSLLTMLIPSVLRGISDGRESRSAHSTLEGKVDTVSNKEAEALSHQTEVCSRLQRLEMLVSRMESFLQAAFSRLDARMTNLEQQISACHQQQQREFTSASGMPLVSQPSEASEARDVVAGEEVLGDGGRAVAEVENGDDGSGQGNFDRKDEGTLSEPHGPDIAAFSSISAPSATAIPSNTEEACAITESPIDSCKRKLRLADFSNGYVV